MVADYSKGAPKLPLQRFCASESRDAQHTSAMLQPFYAGESRNAQALLVHLVGAVCRVGVVGQMR